MKVAGGGNDKRQVESTLVKLQSLPAGLNQPEQFLADTGYFSEKNIDIYHLAKTEQLIATPRATSTTRTGASVFRSRHRWQSRPVSSSR
ncbi:hypothetical protein A8C75_09100 [Marinobacterium aestuarii]|uniref:Uncharacterized protein n=1 Tax=Marinobacterium aestuarii TaxID=1821621 RepID=A0A1A9EWV8_9GAMM|nr:hypothetical protein A8C75_09100 [Marinobacterium aestuarii]